MALCIFIGILSIFLNIIFNFFKVLILFRTCSLSFGLFCHNINLALYSMDHSPAMFKEIVLQLQSSGIQFSIKFIGSVAFETSINSVPQQYQSEVALSCIKFVTNKAGILNVILPNVEQFSKHFDNAKYSIYNNYVDINISSSAILILQANNTLMEILHRFKICEISIVLAGQQELSSFFCFFAKTKKNGIFERRCFVFDGGPCVDEIREVICYAFRINEVEVESNLPPEKSSFSVAPPVIRINNDMCNPLENLSSLYGVDSPQCGLGNKQNLVDCRCPHHSSTFQSPSRERQEFLGFNAQFAAAHCSNELGCLNSNYRHNRSPSANHRLEEMTADLWHQKWFHGKMSRLRAESLLRKKGQFLVRQSPHMENQFVLSGMTEKDIKHICLLSNDGTIDLGCGKFKTIVGLISYCRENSDLPPNRGLTLNLDYPVERQSYPT